MALTWTVSEWGSGSGGVWTSTPQMNLDAAGAVGGGAIFLASSLRTTTIAGDMRSLDAPVLLTFVLSVDANRGVAAPTPSVIEVGLVPDPQPANYSDALLPWTRNEVSLGSFTFTVSVTPLFDRVSLTLSSAAILSCRTLVMSRARWNGRVALSFRASTGPIRFWQNGVLGTSPAAITTTDSPFFSGLAGGPYGGHVRAVRDSRFGMAAFHTELVPDGDQPSLYVRPFDVDPEDEEAKYRPRPGEGTRDDKVPDL